MTGPEPKADAPRAPWRLDAGSVGRMGHVDDDREVGLAAGARWCENHRRSSPPGPRRQRRRRPKHRRPRRRSARPRAPPNSPGDCPSSTIRRGRRPARPGRRRSPRRRRRGPCRAPRRRPWRQRRCASPSCSAAFLRSSPSSRWIGFLPMTPSTTPSRVVRLNALADRGSASPAAQAGEVQKAVVDDVRDNQAESRRCPRRWRGIGPSAVPATRAVEEPMTSTAPGEGRGRLAPDALRRVVSYPDGPVEVSSERRRVKRHLRHAAHDDTRPRRQ